LAVRFTTELLAFALKRLRSDHREGKHRFNPISARCATIICNRV
jgi:hypothetical protein